MGRSIKFRAWDSINKRITYGYFFVDADGGIWYDQNPHGIDMSGTIKIKGINNILTIMQFIGLNDKNSKEIYEGDIIGEYGDPNYFIVVWDERYCSFGAALQNNNSSAINEINEDWMKEIEVIGNIYENNELINP